MNIIKKKRKECGISQKDLSKKLGISQQTVSRIETTDIENIPCNILLKMSNIFQIPIDKLIYGEKKDPYGEKCEELWEIYKKLDETNKTTLLMLGRRLSETQPKDM